MKKKWLVALMLSGAIAMSTVAGLAACDNNKPNPKPGPGIVTPPDDDPPDDKDHVAPTITVTPKEIEIYAGDEIDLMIGVSAVDDEGNTVAVTIDEDDDFDVDSPAEGVYTIKYKATAFGLSAYETRTITVLAELTPITVQARSSFEKPGVWELTDKITFRHKEYHEVTADAEFERMSGVFHNTTDDQVVVSVASGGGCVAIIDANGVLVEGRDGANGKMINEANPERANSSANTFTYEGTTYNASTQFAQKMVIPAHGFAIVLQNSHFGSGSADADGRSFFNNVIINRYRNVIRLYWDDPEATEVDYLTPYADQAPTVSGNTEIFVMPNQAGFDLTAAVKAGLTVKDDNGTFEMSDDVTVASENITVTDDGGFDIAAEGDYIITLSATDGEHATTFTRKVKVVGEEYITRVSIGTGTPIVVMNDKVAKNVNLTKTGSYAFIIYDYTYKQSHETLDFTNGYGGAYVVNKFGAIIRTYDGANGTYSDATSSNKGGVVAPTNYIEKAYESLSEGETLFIASNGGDNNTANTGSRWMFMQLGNRTAIGTVLNFTGFDWESKPYENQPPIVSGATDIIVVPNQSGFDLLTAVRSGLTIKDDGGTFGQTYDATLNNDCVTIKDNGGFDIATSGEYTVTLEATDEGGAKTEFTRKVRVASVSELTFLTIGSSETPLIAVLNSQVAKNIDITSSTVNNYAFLVYDYTYKTTHATVGFANGWGAAYIVNQYGKIVRTYSGADGKYNDATHVESTDSTLITNAGYLNEAYASLSEGEILFVTPNGTESNKSGGSRQIFRDNRQRIGEIFNFTGYTWEEEPEITTVDVKVGADTLTIQQSEYSYNEAKTAAKVEIYNAPATAPVLTGYEKGVAVVVNKFGEVVKVYDGVNNKLYDGTNSEGTALDVSSTKYAAQAYAALTDGDILVLFKGESGDHITYATALGGTIDQTVVLPGVTAEKRGITVSIKGKTFFIDGNAYLENQVPTAPANYQLLVYEYDCGLENVGSGWSYGAALVIDADGKLVRIYDGANGGVYDENGKMATTPSGFSTSTYASFAYNSLQEGETLLIFPNDGGTNVARAFALGCRTDGSIGQTLTLTDTRKVQD